MAVEERDLDLAAALGAEREASTQVLSVYIPNKNRHGRPINPRPWIREAQEILARIGEGYTTREFLHRFGRETDQEVVVTELSGPEGAWFFRIKEYDEEGR